jgi:beta-phosphoglucomutase
VIGRAPRPLQSIVFDFDGVLANTEPLHLDAFRHVLGGRGVNLEAADYFRRYVGREDRAVFREIGRDRGLSWGPPECDRFAAEKAAVYRRAIDTQPVLFDGVGARVREWAREVPVAIASGALREEIDAILAAAGLRGLFTVVVAAGDTASGKPEPDPYRAALGRLGADAGRSVAVEDSVWGITSARRAGMKVVGVTTSHPRDRLAAADAVVTSFEELSLELFDELVTAVSSQSPRRDTTRR